MLEPIDPDTVPLAGLRRRAGLVLDRPDLVPDGPVPAGQYRCGVCLRIRALGWSEAEEHAETVQRFGALPPPEERVRLCDDCDRIMGTAMGFR